MEANVGRHTRRMARGVGVVDPTYEKCGPTDSACVARNAAVGATFGAAQLGEWLAARLASCIALGSNPAGCHAEFDPGGSYAATANAGERANSTYVASVIPPVGGNMQFAFTTSRGSTFNLYPGDTWNITIKGATPGAIVRSSGVMQGKSYNTPFGVIDANGNFTLSGTLTSSNIGNWLEGWYVNEVNVGNIGFAVLTTPPTVVVTQSSQTTPQASGTQTGNVTNTTQDTSGTSTASNQTVFGLFGDTSPVLFGVVNEYTALGIAAALVVGFMMMKGGR